jgi:hypothetical protein
VVTLRVGAERLRPLAVTMRFHPPNVGR